MDKLFLHIKNIKKIRKIQPKVFTLVNLIMILQFVMTIRQNMEIKKIMQIQPKVITLVNLLMLIIVVILLLLTTRQNMKIKNIQPKVITLVNLILLAQLRLILIHLNLRKTANWQLSIAQWRRYMLQQITILLKIKSLIKLL